MSSSASLQVLPKHTTQTAAAIKTISRAFQLLVTACLCLGPGVAIGQVATADILGTVTDTSGAAIPGVVVRIENTETHQLKETKSTDNGSYTFTQLQPGTYNVTIAAPGFKSFSNPSLVLVAGDRARVDAPLQIGAATETVEVSAQPSALQTDSTNVGSTVEAKAIADLPLNGRKCVRSCSGRSWRQCGQPDLNDERYAPRRPSSIQFNIGKRPIRTREQPVA